jgi:hypothetical protein
VLCAQATVFAFLPLIVSLQTGALVWAHVGMLAVESRAPSPLRLAQDRQVLE